MGRAAADSGSIALAYIASEKLYCRLSVGPLFTTVIVLFKRALQKMEMGRSRRFTRNIHTTFTTLYKCVGGGIVNLAEMTVLSKNIMADAFLICISINNIVEKYVFCTEISIP